METDHKSVDYELVSQLLGLGELDKKGSAHVSDIYCVVHILWDMRIFIAPTEFSLSRISDSPCMAFDRLNVTPAPFAPQGSGTHP